MHWKVKCKDTTVPATFEQGHKGSLGGEDLEE